MSPRTLIAILAAAASLALAGTASAESISFIRGGDIWVASPDGTKTAQITHTGGYSYQSQADDGTFIALAGRHLHRIDRKGQVLADFSTPVSAEKVDDNTSYFMGPFDPEISPDGTKVVYSYLWQSIYTKPGCTGPDWLCKEKHLYQGVGYSHADRMTGWDEPGFGKQSGWVHPSWMGNDKVLLSDPSEILNLDVMFDTVGGDNQDIQDWFSDPGAIDLNDGEINRQGTMMAFLSSDPSATDPAGQEKSGQVTLYRMAGAAPALPQPCYSLGYAAGSYEGPTWSPAGNRIAFADRAQDETGKILVADVPDLAGGCATGGAAVVTIPDARHPDWGPADMPEVAPVPKPKTAQEADDPANTTTVTTDPTNDARRATKTATLSLRGRTLARALRRGVVVHFRAPGAGTISARALRGSRVVGSGSKRAARRGTVAVRVRFSARGRRALRGQRSVRIAVQLTFRSA